MNITLIYWDTIGLDFMGDLGGEVLLTDAIGRERTLSFRYEIRRDRFDYLSCDGHAMRRVEGGNGLRGPALIATTASGLTEPSLGIFQASELERNKRKIKSALRQHVQRALAQAQPVYEDALTGVMVEQ